MDCGGDGGGGGGCAATLHEHSKDACGFLHLLVAFVLQDFANDMWQHWTTPS
jgi:hypothetical protein